METTSRRGESGEARATPVLSEAGLEPLRFDDVYAEHFDFVCRSLRLLGIDAEGIEDAAQDVFAIVSRRLAEFVQRAAVKTWLFAIVQRVAANQRRWRRRRQNPLEPLSQPMAGSDASPEAEAQAREAAALVQAFAAELDDGHRAVLVLALIERVPVRDVAESLGIPQNTVYSRIRAVRQGLEAFLVKNEVEA